MILLLKSLGWTLACMVPGSILGIIPFVYFSKHSREKEYIFAKSYKHFTGLIYIAFLLIIPVFVCWEINLLKEVSQLSLNSSYHFFSSILSYISAILFLTFGFGMTAFWLSLHKQPAYRKTEYLEGGRLYYWGPATQAYRKKIGWHDRFHQHAVSEIALMFEQGKGPVVVAGPSAMRGENELEFGMRLQLLIDRPVQVFASDRESPADRLPNLTTDGTSFSYSSNVEALEIHGYLPKGKADVIYDIRGALWHAGHKEARDLLLYYYQILEDAGIVVIDAEKSWSFFRSFHVMYGHFTGRLLGSAESSTYEKLLPKLRRHPFLLELFEVQHKKDGKYSVAFLKKRVPIKEGSLAS